jgi:hypothetical protein
MRGIPYIEQPNVQVSPIDQNTKKEYVAEVIRVYADGNVLFNGKKVKPDKIKIYNTYLELFQSPSEYYKYF